MSRGPRMSISVKKYVVKEAVRAENRQIPRRFLVSMLKDRIEQMGEIVPKDETLEKLVSWARNHAPDPEDEPWSLGSLNEFPIPLDSLTPVLQAWKFCLAAAGPVVVDNPDMAHTQPLSIREAKWVARLHGVIPNNTDKLVMWANQYAIEEQVGKHLKEESPKRDFNTLLLDASLIMGLWEWSTFVWIRTRVNPEVLPELIEGPEILSFRDDSSRRAAEYSEGHFLTRIRAANAAKANVFAKLGTLDDLNLSEEAEWVYSHWMKYLSKGPNWRSLKYKDALIITQKLRQWIKNHPCNDLDNEKAELIIRAGLRRDLKRLSEISEFAPWELIKEVGYKI